jgi:hypothetical protein
MARSWMTSDFRQAVNNTSSIAMRVCSLTVSIASSFYRNSPIRSGATAERFVCLLL